MKLKRCGNLIALLSLILCVFCDAVFAQTGEIVLRASDVTIYSGTWQVVSDASAAGGSRIAQLNAGAPKQRKPLAAPTHYVELTFSAEAGKPYHLWLRGKAENDHWANDSVYVQFSGSVNDNGEPVYRIGSTSATTVILEEARGRGLSGWGWQDNGWGILGRDIYFAASGPQTIRLQTREDGLSIDQIVLSPKRFLDVSPGAPRNDSVILPQTGGPQSSNRPPQVNITASVDSGQSPLPVVFSSQASDSDGEIASYSWDFGDGTKSSSAQASHTYQSSGTYTAKLTVEDDKGASASAKVEITVSNSVGGTPLTVITWNVHKGVGTDEELNLNRIVNWLAKLKPDVVELCEINRYSIGTDTIRDQVQYVADGLKSKTGQQWYFKWVPVQSGAVQGAAILSKFKFTDTGGKYLKHSRSVTQVALRVNGRTINFFGTHLDNDSPGHRLKQAAELTDWMKNFAGPSIVGGDFNASPGASEIRVVTALYGDAWADAVKDNTDVGYPDNTSGRTRRSRIDYLFYTRNSHLRLKGARVVDTRDLSDRNVRMKLGTPDDKGVRPSDHNLVMATFEVN